MISQDPAADTMVAPGSTVTLVISTGPCPRTVPNVTGMSQGAAESAITGDGFTVGSVTEECSDTVAAGNVISQDPAGGTEADFGASVNLVVSTGPCPVAVPAATSCDDITAAGLVCNLIEQCDNSVAAGSVISQDPAADTMVAPGSTVTLVISTGPCPRTVPNVTGMSQGAAESAITGDGFTVGSVTEECSDTVAAGNVISQDPAGGTEADFGASVNLVVSTGPCPVAVPAATSCDDITAAGLVCNLIEQCDNSVAAGSVISQDPAADTMVAPGSTVTLVISTGPCPRTVPNVTGMSQGAAESAITGDGFTVGSVTEECSDTVAAGNVISQDPAGGTEADFGASVNLVVSTGPCPVAGTKQPRAVTI